MNQQQIDFELHIRGKIIDLCVARLNDNADDQECWSVVVWALQDIRMLESLRYEPVYETRMLPLRQSSGLVWRTPEVYNWNQPERENVMRKPEKPIEERLRETQERRDSLRQIADLYDKRIEELRQRLEQPHDRRASDRE